MTFLLMPTLAVLPVILLRVSKAYTTLLSLFILEVRKKGLEQLGCTAGPMTQHPGTGLPGCHYQTPAHSTSHNQPQHCSAPSPRPGHMILRSKDIRDDWKSSWKAFLHKFVRLAHSEQWTEVEQYDQFCLALEGTASEYYIIQLLTDPGARLGAILKKFEKGFGSSARDLTHQLIFQSAVQGS